MSSPGWYPPSHPGILIAAQGHPKTKGPLHQLPGCYTNFESPPSLQYFAISLGSSLPSHVTCSWARKCQRLDKQTVEVYRDEYTDSCCFSHAFLRVQLWRVQKIGYLWTKFLWLFLFSGLELIVSPDNMIELQWVDFPPYRIVLENTMI